MATVRVTSLVRRKLTERIAVVLSGLALALALLPLFHILYTALSIGSGALSWSFFSESARGLPYVGTEGGVLNGIAGTAILLFLGGLIAVPFGVLVGLYLADFGDGPVGHFIRAVDDVLIGVPSVIWGLFGYLFLANIAGSYGLHLGFSGLAGGIILGLIMLPLVAGVTELSLREVPRAFREASLALGATRWHTTRRISLRVARPGIATGVLLALTNALGQTVALLLTNGYTYFMPHLPLWGQANNVTDLGSMIYVYLSQPSPKLQPPAEAAIVVLMAFVLLMSILARTLSGLGRRYAS